jgi:hypothetical protein
MDTILATGAITRDEKRWFNGIRLSPHIFNTEADVDAALRAIRTELARRIAGAVPWGVPCRVILIVPTVPIVLN